jgi:hypothetical protein
LLERRALLAEIANQAVAGNPPGTVIFENPSVPPWNVGGWKKYGVARITHRWTGGNNYITRWAWSIHYMYNVNSHEVAELKMKNSYESGCTGVARPYYPGAET